MHRGSDEADPIRFPTATTGYEALRPASASGRVHEPGSMINNANMQRQQRNKPADLHSQWRLFRFSSSLSLPQVAHAASSPFNYASNKFWRLTSQIAARYAPDNNDNNSSRLNDDSNRSSMTSATHRGFNNIPTTQASPTVRGVITRDLSLPSYRPENYGHDHAMMQLLRHERRRCRRKRVKAQTAAVRAQSSLTPSADEESAFSSSQEEDSSSVAAATSADTTTKSLGTIPNDGLWPMTMPCRVCMQDSVIDSPLMARRQLDLVRPCRCTGTVAWVHNACLASWVFMDNVGGSGPAAHPRCELCSTRYAFRLRRRPFRQWAMSLVSHSALFWVVSLAALPLPTLNFLCNVHALRFGKFLSICDSTDFNELKWCATSLAGMVMFWCANDYCRFLETWRGGATSAGATKAGLFVYMGICVLCLSSNDLRRTWRKWRSAQFEVDFEDFSPPPPPPTPPPAANGAVAGRDEVKPVNVIIASNVPVQ